MPFLFQNDRQGKGPTAKVWATLHSQSLVASTTESSSLLGFSHLAAALFPFFILKLYKTNRTDMSSLMPF